MKKQVLQKPSTNLWILNNIGIYDNILTKIIIIKWKTLSKKHLLLTQINKKLIREVNRYEIKKSN